MNILLRNVVERLVRTGDLTVIDAEGAAHDFGDRTGRKVTVVVRSAHAERAITLDPMLALPEMWMDGEFDVLEH